MDNQLESQGKQVPQEHYIEGTSFFSPRERTPLKFIKAYKDRQLIPDLYQAKKPGYGLFHVIHSNDSDIRDGILPFFLHDLNENLSRTPLDYRKSESPFAKSLLVDFNCLDLLLNLNESDEVETFAVWKVMARRAAHVLSEDSRYHPLTILTHDYSNLAEKSGIRAARRYNKARRNAEERVGSERQIPEDQIEMIKKTAKEVTDEISFANFMKTIQKIGGFDHIILMVKDAAFLETCVSPNQGVSSQAMVESLYQKLGGITPDPELNGGFSVLLTFPLTPLNRQWGMDPKFLRPSQITFDRLESLVPHVKIIELTSGGREISAPYRLT